MSLLNILSDFRQSISDCNRNIVFAHQRYRNDQYKINRDLREFISESSFLRMYVSWETFLEKSFIAYLLQEPSITNNRPAKYSFPLNESHARELLIGTQKYVDWSNPEIVRKLSIIHFHNGYVYNRVISSALSDLFDLRIIRNSAAHISSSTSTQLDILSGRILRKTCRDYTPYKLLFSINPNTSNNETVLKYYIDIIDISAENIANG
jgi:hypothetical protein